MNLFKIVLFATLIYSCNSPTKNNEQKETPEENWQITTKITKAHSYNKFGLLDTTYETHYFYVNGEVGVVINTFIIRNYDIRNNLIKEKTFQVEKENILTDEKEMKYDFKNNLIEEITKSDNVVNSIIKIQYNTLNQEINRISIRKILEATPEGWNLDSAVAHKDDTKKTPRYDTSVIIFSYDKQGNQISETTSNTRNKTKITLASLYANGQKTLSYELDENGDTITVIKYQKEGNLIRKTVNTIVEPTNSFTTWYNGNKEIKSIFIDSKNYYKSKETYQYDEKGNEIESVHYK